MADQEKYICPVCNKTFKYSKNLTVQCPQCKIDLLDMDISIEDWEALSPKEKRAKIDDLNARRTELLYLDRIHKRLRTISRWVVFFGVLFVISIIVVSFNTCGSMK